MPSWTVTGAIVLASSPQSNVTVCRSLPRRTKVPVPKRVWTPLASESSIHDPPDGLNWRTSTV